MGNQGILPKARERILAERHAIEESVIGSLLDYPSLAGPYGITAYNASMFTGVLAKIFTAFQTVFVRDGNATDAAIALELGPHFEECGGFTKLYQLHRAAVVPVALQYQLQRLKDIVARNRIEGLLAAYKQQLEAGAIDTGEAIAGINEGLECIQREREVTNGKTLKAVVMEAVSNINDRASGKNHGESTGIASLDRITGGVRRGSQWVIAGPAKGGKSSLALTLLASLVFHAEKRIALFGLEMPSVENIERLLCHLSSDISASHLRDGKVTEGSMSAIQRTASRVCGAPIHVRDDVFDLVGITASIAQIKAAYPDLFAVFVDYAQLVESPSKANDNREREVANVSRTLRTCGLRHDVAIILLSQTNDDGKLRESRTLGMDATKILTISFGEGSNERLLKVVQRDGQSGIELKLAYVGEHFRFADYAD